MIIFEKIRFKNFLSFGNTFTEIVLNHSPTTLIVGENGAGKSTLLDALTFVLFGKPFRKFNKPQLVNSVNKKQCMVEIEFHINKNHYLVRRGIKPAVFEIEENGNLIAQDAANGDYQGFLEKHILKMNLTAFTQIVILGKATYVPFMRLPAKQRRTLIEELLGLTIFSKMNEVLSQRNKDLKNELANTETFIRGLNDKIEIRKEFIEKVTGDKEAELKEVENEIADTDKNIKDYRKDIKRISEEVSTLTSQKPCKSEIDKKHTQLNNYNHEFKVKINALTKEIKFLTSNDSCPTCNQEIDDTFCKNIVSKNESKIGRLEEGQLHLVGKLDSVEKELSEYQSLHQEIHKLDVELNGKQNSLDELERYKEKLLKRKDNLNKMNTVDVDNHKEILDILNSDLNDHLTKKNELVEKQGYHSSIGLMLKDDGIKSLIVNKYLPVFNQSINKYLQHMGMFVKFTLDEQFNETILARYMDTYSYESFSEGQKLRIDLAIMLTWRDIAKMKNAMDTNLLIMDEVFDSSLDQSGIDSFVDLIPSMKNTNVFVVSHTPDKLSDKFRSQLEIKLDGNFSRIM